MIKPTIKEFKYVILDAVRAVVDNYRMNEPDKQIAIKVADEVFIITKYDKKTGDHGIYFEVMNKKGTGKEYFFICFATQCSHSKSKMLKIIEQITNANGIKSPLVRRKCF